MPTGRRSGQPSGSRSRDCTTYPALRWCQTLGKIMLDSATPPATRVRAAESILDHAAKAIEIEEIEGALRRSRRWPAEPPRR